MAHLRMATASSVAHIAIALLIAGMVAVAPIAHAADEGHYTAAQAQAGRTVYATNCALCHGANLQGGSAPVLVGGKFTKSLQSDPMTAPQLYEFITSHMPGGEPGVLGDAQFLQVFAFVLSMNGHPAGDRPLSRQTLGEVKLLPNPGAKQGTR